LFVSFLSGSAGGGIGPISARRATNAAFRSALDCGPRAFFAARSSLRRTCALSHACRSPSVMRLPIAASACRIVTPD